MRQVCKSQCAVGAAVGIPEQPRPDSHDRRQDFAYGAEGERRAGLIAGTANVGIATLVRAGAAVKMRGCCFKGA